MIELSVAPARSSYVSGEDVDVIVNIVNRGATPVELPDPSRAGAPQPVYWLAGPEWPQGLLLTNSRILESEADATSATGAPLLTLAPGAEYNTRFTVTSVVPLNAPGEYRLRSGVLWQTVRVQSQESVFRIGSMQPSSIHLGSGSRPSEAGEGEGAFLQPAGKGSQLYSFTFRELRPSIGEAVVSTLIPRLETGPDAREVAVPFRNAPFFNELVRWVVWREGRSVKALPNTSTTPVSFQSESDIAELVRPPLKTTGGPVEVLLVSASGAELEMVTFTPASGEAGAQARLAWRAKLPGKPAAIAAALGPENTGSDRHVAFAVARAEGFEVFHARYRGNAPLAPFQSAAFNTGALLPNAAPAILAQADGKVLVSVLSRGGEGRRMAILAEATFTGAGQPATRTVNLGELPQEPLTATLLYVDKEGQLVRREAVIATQGGKLLRMHGDRLEPISETGRYSTPIVLTPGKDTSYILYFDPAKGLYVEPAR